MSLDRLPLTVYLKTEFRMELFSKAYCEEGSLSLIGVALGYRSRPGLNGVSRDMWLGRSGIPRNRVARLLKLTGVSLDEFIKNIIPKEESEEVLDWLRYYEAYKLRKNEHKIKPKNSLSHDK